MRIKTVSIYNYRMLYRVPVDIEDDITLIVGKNNSGKTSFFEIIRMMVSEESRLSFEDFSQKCYKEFKEADKLYGEYLLADDEAKELLLKKLQDHNPKIELQLHITYDKEKDSLKELSEFITDLDPARNDACICISYECTNTLSLFKAFRARPDSTVSLLKYLKENIQVFYRTNCYALDAPSGKRKMLEGAFKNKILKVVSFEEIKALRILDDKKGDRNNTLALGFSKYYKERDKSTEEVERLEGALKDIGKDLKEKYRVILANILKDLKTFGADTPIIIPDIIIDSVFDSEAVMKNNIRYFYKQDEIDLPESYNGLGYSNLIYMILELASFIEKHKNAKDEKISEFLVIMIEEPEAHMHPQMQQVFIRQINDLLKNAKSHGITIQLIITSHSSHIISEAGIDLKKGFNRIRYFIKGQGEVIPKDFNHLQIDNEKATFRFLKQYLNLHKSDLFFADKVIMVEGVTERLLMPQMIAKVAPSLQREYITVLEVGGAYTHKFEEILAFIDIKTLIVTDLDSKDAETNIACAVDINNKTLVTSNETLISWLPKKSIIVEILASTEDEKIFQEKVRVAFQINEINAEYYSRSFEEAFIECNKKLLLSSKMVEVNGVETEKKVKNYFSLLRGWKTEDLTNAISYELAPTTSKAKTNFAFDVMSFDEEIFGSWQVPQYIKEGLEWLSGICVVNYKISVE
ncbi:Predicted ATP-dependent endonuclease of the OLD family, contains P-loop ATPase and TOPRIM domains [Mucilaginibacter gossypiicola]|uniref:Predicted ATP-dependent endonuclease of the OLD family, contains P-loop ATPase and TOPRIM domains n=1 Tax=Mucilaginibacter gossypiicola TaxID=551995 RepID=A0A1H8SZN0_9SPHI|nr:AAA family ATPase [Mucilaginibacter gossypiicola]SEO84127.1 Predicted ATP-dependent endonuclease of the OLD family, contains P-loop ATPase and TOPRIM domains [Mucilaginibacter gossypiicola]